MIPKEGKTINTEKLTLDDSGNFCWNYGQEFFIETAKGNFIWSDPDYHGDNTIRPYTGTIGDYCKQNHLRFLRDKGDHFVRDYCGKDVKIV